MLIRTTVSCGSRLVLFLSPCLETEAEAAATRMLYRYWIGRGGRVVLSTVFSGESIEEFPEANQKSSRAVITRSDPPLPSSLSPSRPSLFFILFLSFLSFFFFFFSLNISSYFTLTPSLLFFSFSSFLSLPTSPLFSSNFSLLPFLIPYFSPSRNLYFPLCFLSLPPIFSSNLLPFLRLSFPYIYFLSYCLFFFLSCLLLLSFFIYPFPFSYLLFSIKEKKRTIPSL